MKNMLLATAALVAAPLMLTSMAAPAAAQSRLGVAVVNVDTAIGQSAAAQTASQQMQTTYKATIDDITARQTALQTEIKQKDDAFKAAVTAAGEKPTAAQTTSLQTQYDALRRRAQEAENELQQLQVPLQRARAYVVEQIAAKLEDALKNVMTKNKVDLLLKEAAVEAYQPAVNLTSALVTELNTLVPTVGIVPPQNWQPGGQQQAAAPAAGAPAAAAPAPAATPAPANRPTGR
jgi:Skp family chaperone for outer membrane proteins